MSKHFTFLILIFACLPFAISAQTVTGALGETFSYRVVAGFLSDPWEITYGPDDYLWVTEAKGYKVSRINPTTGSKITLLDLSSYKNFGREQSPQGGLMGLALHPQLLSGKPYVYLAYIHNFSGCVSNDGGCFFKTKIVRYTYNALAQSLDSPVTLVDTIPGSNDHNGGRLAIAAIGGIDYLFYSVGDMGAGQFNNAGRVNNAQNPWVYEGKVLRFNLEGDSDKGFDQWIPNTNPFNSKKAFKQSAVWSIGHRNPQGLAEAIISGVHKLFSAEHGPFSDDEINIIERRRNYGHPLVVGMNDGNYDGLSAAVSANTTLPGVWQTSCPKISSESANVSAMVGYQDPIKTFYPSSNSYLDSILTAVKNNNYSTGFPNASSESWESEAVSSIAYYSSNAIPGWNNSLLITTLKGGKVIRLQLNSTGSAVTSDTINYFKGANRYRDIAFSNDGTKIYLAIDSSLITSGPSANDPQVSTNRGSILEFTYTGNISRQNLSTTFSSKQFSTRVNVFPNPARDWITVKLDDNMLGLIKYKLTDLAGRVLIEGQASSDNIRINIGRLIKGVYIVRFENQKQGYDAYKVVKE